MWLPDPTGLPPLQVQALTEEDPQDCSVLQGGLPCRAPHGSVAKVSGVGQVGFSQGLVHTIRIGSWDQAL